ncbi:polymer-forming cytoskeletal protein [Rugamonas sp. DEMB1]|uniref:polymer-forming cytoskeletal protein n=1 Tax=Rugamonas sp. DEMB1 TaxID=3039386 RepID=UPI002446FC68|nr:polymer-forming cytoskeletal protein [Rugamonas sp. DEMB1]WGG49908.1 polymer-forming cytoskeletal protein [Rugamonas sp. DEMB1]
MTISLSRRATLTLRLALLLALAWLAAPAHAALNFAGGAVAGCGYTAASRTYNCATLPTNQDIAIASGYTVSVTGSLNFDNNQQLAMSGSASLRSDGDLNIGNIKSDNLQISGGTLVAGGKFSIGAQAQSIVADVTAASMQIGTGSATRITGSLTCSGPIDFASHSVVVGAVSGSVVTSGAHFSLSGSIRASVSFELASGSDVVGDIVAPTVTLRPAQSSVRGNITASTELVMGSGDEVTGNVNAGALTMDPANGVITGNVNVTGDVTMGSNNTIDGDLVARNVTMHAANGIITGNATVNSIVLNHHDRVGKIIRCTGAGAAGCSCVTNNSGYPTNGSAPGPVCGPAPPSGPHHIQISHPGTGLTCQPQTVALTACANAACTPPHYSASTAVTLSPGGATFTISGGVNNAASVKQGTAGTATLAVTTAGLGTVCVNTGANNSSCAMQFSDTGLSLSVPDHIADTPQTLSVSALQKVGNNPSCVPLFAGLSRSINFSCGYTNPVAANAAPVPLLLGLGGTPLAANASSACSAAGQNLTLAFNANGQASTPLQYAEAGKLSINAKYADAGLVVVGSTSVTVAPDRFTFAMKQTAAPGKTNPAVVTPLPAGVVAGTPAAYAFAAAAAVAGPAFIKAGEAFSMTLSAVNKNGKVTTNFGKESPAESYTLSQALVAPNPVTYPSADNPGLSSNFGAMGNGVASVASTSWNAVGVFSLTATLVNTSGYLGAGAASFRTTGTANVGRFIPDHFNVVLAAPAKGVPMCATPASCAANEVPSVYSHQPFAISVAAYGGAAVDNSANLMKNYQGALAKKVDFSGWRAAGSLAPGDKNPPTTPSGAGRVDESIAAGVEPVSPGAGVFSGGLAGTALSYKFSSIDPAPDQKSKLSAPTTLYLRAADSDLASSARGAASLEPALRVLSGRLLVSAGYGSESSPMPLTLRAQYWNGANYVYNSLDNNQTGYTLNTLSFANCQGKLQLAGAPPGTCNGTLLGLQAASVLRFTSGDARVMLRPPGGSGAVDIWISDANNPIRDGDASHINILPFLPSAPSAPGHIVFGVYRSGPVLYLREVY